MSRHQGKLEKKEFGGEELPKEFKLSRSKIMYIEENLTESRVKHVLEEYTFQNQVKLSIIMD